MSHYPALPRWKNPLVDIWRDWIVADWLTENSKRFWESPNWQGPVR